MKRMTVECDCERGGDCTRTTMCALDSALQDQAEEFEAVIQELAENWRRQELAFARSPLSNGDPVRDGEDCADEIDELLEK